MYHKLFISVIIFTVTDVTNSFLNCCIKYNFHHLNLGETSVICSADAFFFFLKEIILFSHGKENAI